MPNHDSFTPAKLNDTEFQLVGASGQTTNTSVALSAQNSKQSTVSVANSLVNITVTTDPTAVPVNAGDLVVYFDTTVGAAKVFFKGKNSAGTSVSGNVALS